MKKPSVTYRFFCALTACTVLLSVSIPAGLHASDLTDLCAMVMAEHDAASMSGPDHCDSPENHEAKHDAVNAHVHHSETADCYLGSICTCTIGEASVKANAVPSLSKMFAGYIPVLVQILEVTPDSGYPKSSEQVFASLYSPPLFLMNSSFLN